MRRYPDISQPDFKSHLNYSDANNADIIRTVESNFDKAVEQTKKFAQRFKSHSRLQSALKIWEFLRQNIQYVRDPQDAQMIRMPSRFVVQGKGDCKSYSLFTASILANLKMPVAFRYASYDGGVIPSHVYVVTEDEKGKPIIIDGVYKFFNKEKTPTNKFDHIMKVYTLSGYEDDSIGKFRIKIKKPKLKVAKFLKTNVKSTAKKVGKVAKKGFKAAKLLYLAPARNAFKLLVAFNVRGLATNLAKALQKDPAKVKQFWGKFGGNFGVLERTIRSGAKKKRLLGHNGIGIDPSTVGTTIAVAAPVLLVAIHLLKSVGVKGAAVDQLQSAAEVAAMQNPDAAKYFANSSGGGGGEFSSGGGSYSSKDEDDFNDDGKPDDEPESIFNTKNLLIGGGLLLGFYLLTKKGKR